MPNHNENLERLLDLIADYLITSDIPGIRDSVNSSQKYIRDGQLQSGQGSGVLALFQKDIRANQEDLNTLTTINPGEENEEVIPTLQNLANTIDFSTLNISSSLNGDNNVSIFLVGGGANFPDGGEDITNLLIGDGNPLNVSQFIPLSQKKSNIDIQNAEEYLDTNIFELIPSGDTRQSRIIRFFQELNALLPPDPPEFDLFDSEGNPNPDGRVDRAPDNSWTGSLQYQKDNSISYAQSNPAQSNIDEEDAFIHRLKSTANDTNSSRTIEDIYNRIVPYLTDILEDEISIQDDRPEYQNQSSGYLKFRNPNQGIIIRNTNQDFIQGLNPNNPTYLETGFTITMWVRFLDKVSNGTLFNFGNPVKNENPFGFKLDTFMSLDGERRHLRLLVLDNNSGFGENPFDSIHWYDSHVPSLSGGIQFPKLLTELNEISALDTIDFSQYLEVPIDFNEWYFICATYNPNINEQDSNQLIFDTNYWNNHMVHDVDSDDPTNQYTSNSGFGNRAKVEIISRTDLLRARGFRV